MLSFNRLSMTDVELPAKVKEHKCSFRMCGSGAMRCQVCKATELAPAWLRRSL
jgi:hypothetical protein